MYGNRVYVIAQDINGYHYNNLWEMKFGAGGGTWTNFGSSPFSFSLSTTPPTVLYDGSLFFIDSKGELINMWWNGSQWIFLNNGYCEVDGWGFWKTYIGAVSVGAPMGSSKVFVTCSDGTLRQRWYDSSHGGSWHWVNHGKPAWYQNGKIVTGYADTPPIALGDGHVFLNVSTSSSGTTATKNLVQLWYSGTGWVWAPAGHPASTYVTGAVTGDPTYPPNVYTRGLDNNYWDAQWNGSTFVWINLGH